MNKKIFALFTAVVLLISMIAAVGVSADEPVCVTNNLDSLEPFFGKLVANDTGTVNISGKSLLIKTQRAEYGLNGNPNSTPSGYNASYNASRRTCLTPFADGMTLPAGTYTVSVYVYEKGEHLGDQTNHYSEIALSLHTADETDDVLAHNHANHELITLFNATQGAAAPNEGVNFAKSGVVKKVGMRNWAEYTATITTTEPKSQFAFWLIGDPDNGETLTVSTYIEDLSIYNEAGTPETSETTTETTSATTASQTTKATSAASGDSTQATASAVTEEPKKTGCKASAGIAVSVVAIGTVISGLAVSKKKK